MFPLRVNKDIYLIDRKYLPNYNKNSMINNKENKKEARKNAKEEQRIRERDKRIHKKEQEYELQQAQKRAEQIEKGLVLTSVTFVTLIHPTEPCSNPYITNIQMDGDEPAVQEKLKNNPLLCHQCHLPFSTTIYATKEFYQEKNDGNGIPHQY